MDKNILCRVLSISFRVCLVLSTILICNISCNSDEADCTTFPREYESLGIQVNRFVTYEYDGTSFNIKGNGSTADFTFLETTEEIFLQTISDFFLSVNVLDESTGMINARQEQQTTVAAFTYSYYMEDYIGVLFKIGNTEVLKFSENCKILNRCLTFSSLEAYCNFGCPVISNANCELTSENEEINRLADVQTPTIGDKIHYLVVSQDLELR